MITQSYLLHDHKGTFDITSGTLLLRKNDTFLFANYIEGSGQKKGMRYAVSGVRKRGLWRAQSAELLFSILHFLDI